MATKDDGGPAFPCVPPLDPEGGSASGYPYPAAGISTRDLFALKAMQGMLAHPECDYSPMTASAQEQVALDAYGMADAMLKARSQP